MKNDHNFETARAIKNMYKEHYKEMAIPDRMNLVLAVESAP